MLRDIVAIVSYGISFSNIRSCAERYNISVLTLKPSNSEVAKAEGREDFKAWTCFMFTQFPCNTCVFGLSCAGSYLCVFVLVLCPCFLFLFFCFFVFPVCLFFFFSYNVGVLSRSQSRRKCFT